MPPHAIRGTGGDEPIADLEMQPTDLLLPKRRMSAFYKTDLDQTLRTWGVDTVAVCGIVTNVCVLLTALDAIQNDFRSVIVSDACACHKPALHEMTLGLYDKFILAPLFRIMPASEITEELERFQAAGITDGRGLLQGVIKQVTFLECDESDLRAAKSLAYSVVLRRFGDGSGTRQNFFNIKMRVWAKVRRSRGDFSG